MPFGGFNQNWGDESSIADAMQARGRLSRLWGRVRGHGRGGGGSRGRSEGAAVFSNLAAAQAPGPGAGEPIRHLAEAASGPLAETRLAREIRRLVASLGATRGDVALTLERHRVRGVPGERGPVACFLETVIGADPNVKSVMVESEKVVVELRAWWRPAVVVKLPSVVRDVTAAFEAGCYPRLLPDGYRQAAEAEQAGD